MGNKKKPSLDIKKVKSKADEQVPRNNQYDIIPSHPRGALFIGKTGSGKTNLMASLLTEKHFMKRYFDKIYIFAPHANENLYKTIKKKNQKDDVCEVKLIPKLNEEKLSRLYATISRKHKHDLEEFGETEKCLILIDDFSKNPVMRSETLVDIFTACRHVNTSCWLLFHGYKMVEPVIRMNSIHMCIFPINTRDVENFIEEWADANDSRDDIKKMFALTRKVKHSFVHMNIRRTEPFSATFKYRFKDDDGNWILDVKRDQGGDFKFIS